MILKIIFILLKNKKFESNKIILQIIQLRKYKRKKNRPINESIKSILVKSKLVNNNNN